MRTPVRVFVCARILASVTALLGVSAFPAAKIIAQQGYMKPDYSRIFELLVGVWERADGIWYLGIAQNGYHVDPAAHAFMPLYPMLIRSIHTIIPFPPIVAALLISNLAFLGALVIFHRLAQSEGDRESADRALWYLALFPGALFFFAPYTESLFLFLATGSLWMARSQKWWRAAALACLLGLTRNIGVLITLALLLEWIRQRRAIGEKPNFSSLLKVLIIPSMGLASWAAYCGWSSGDPLIFVHQQSQWQRQQLAPWLTLAHGLEQAWSYAGSYPGAGYLYEAAAVLGGVILGVVGLVRRWISLPLSAYFWLMLLPALSAPFEGRMLMSCVRFVAVLFPAFIVLGRDIRSQTTDQAVRLSFAGAYGIAVAMYVCNQYMY